YIKSSIIYINTAFFNIFEIFCVSVSNSLNSTCGRESIDVRMVIDAIIVKHKLELDNRGTIAMISKNSCLSCFCGL
ncbi:MAG: hypothetical protein ACWIPI_05310, partial [Polaribacter sp.]